MSKIKKVSIGILLSLLFVMPLRAQIDQPSVQLPALNVSKNSQRMFEEALKDVVFCMRQEYVIVNRRGQSFGHLDKEYFGQKYAIGILIERDLFFPTYLLKPWVGDKNFAEFSKTHKPKYSKLTITNVSGTIERELANLDVDTTVAITSFKQGGRSLSISDPLNPENGYLMLYHIPEQSTRTLPEIMITLHLLNNVAWNEFGIAEIKNFHYSSKETIGGVFLTESITTGLIQLKVSGMYIDRGNKWVLERIPELKDD